MVLTVSEDPGETNRMMTRRANEVPNAFFGEVRVS